MRASRASSPPARTNAGVVRSWRLTLRWRFLLENNQDIRNWNIVCLVSLNLDDQQAARQSEDYFIDMFRQQGAELLNSNRAIDPNIRRRTYNRNWRAQNPGSMASYARERRKRLKAGLLSPRRKYK